MLSVFEGGARAFEGSVRALATFIVEAARVNSKVPPSAHAIRCVCVYSHVGFSCNAGPGAQTISFLTIHQPQRAHCAEVGQRS